MQTTLDYLDRLDALDGLDALDLSGKGAVDRWSVNGDKPVKASMLEMKTHHEK
jgi:hypothetical protein